MKKSTSAKGPHQSPKPRFIRDLPDDIYYDFMAYAKKQGKTVGQELMKLMQAHLAAMLKKKRAFEKAIHNQGGK